MLFSNFFLSNPLQFTRFRNISQKKEAFSRVAHLLSMQIQIRRIVLLLMPSLEKKCDRPLYK